MLEKLEAGLIEPECVAAASRYGRPCHTRTLACFLGSEGASLFTPLPAARRDVQGGKRTTLALQRTCSGTFSSSSCARRWACCLPTSRARPLWPTTPFPPTMLRKRVLCRARFRFFCKRGRVHRDCQPRHAPFPFVPGPSAGRRTTSACPTNPRWSRPVTTASLRLFFARCCQRTTPTTSDGGSRSKGEGDAGHLEVRGDTVSFFFSRRPSLCAALSPTAGRWGPTLMPEPCASTCRRRGPS